MCLVIGTTIWNQFVSQWLFWWEKRKIRKDKKNKKKREGKRERNDQRIKNQTAMTIFKFCCTVGPNHKCCAMNFKGPKYFTTVWRKQIGPRLYIKIGQILVESYLKFDFYFFHWYSYIKTKKLAFWILYASQEADNCRT